MLLGILAGAAGILTAAALFFAYSCCVVAARADQAEEQIAKKQ